LKYETPEVSEIFINPYFVVCFGAVLAAVN